MSTNDNVRLELELYGAGCTDNALAFTDPDQFSIDPIWLPRSQVENLDALLDGLEDGIGWTTKEMVEVIIPRWLAESNGLDLHAEEIE